MRSSTMYSDGGTAEKLSTKVVRAIAAYENVKPTNLEEPFYDVIDLEALDSLFAERSKGNPRGEGRVIFTYGDYEVTVFSDGRVDVDPLDDA